jgi:hypothetical protein
MMAPWARACSGLATLPNSAGSSDSVLRAAKNRPSSGRRVSDPP